MLREQLYCDAKRTIQQKEGRMIKTVTITGADDFSKPEEIIKLTEEYPTLHTEWGLALSKKREGQPQYPSRTWINEFILQSKGQKLALAGHLCGEWLAELIACEFTYHRDRPDCWDAFDRVQLNFSKRSWPGGDEFPADLINYDKTFIFQMEGVNDKFYNMAMEGQVQCYPLFDMSLGNGISPEKWPSPLHPYLNGYAGGLGPDNLAEELKKIEEITFNNPIWIDMTTKVRTNDQLDLEKVRRVFDILVYNT